ncbi:hypothetical protein BXY85_1734 [Roseivirga pacifica]|uniref:Uncharacterized protein n=1 Tax=Roseivirga pacifica TaxID=1267423 RepID=A0A1I0MUP7_9BACT|nr:hypothetical protein [Roseivirga pacifica]RKQ50715.1 hypothetical protein BXY85_1734 [Roseivirga pacifica]SEV92464.1 hypothetical protein SAMN05216290_0717 [Roseivirga pacifica]
MKKYTFLITLSFLLANACGDQKIDTEKAKAEMKAREIKKVSDAEILEKAMEMGNELAKDFSYSTDATVLETDAQFSSKLYLFDSKASGKTQQILAAYKYNAANDIASEPNVQILEDPTIILYSKPAFNQANVPIGMWAIELPRKEVVLAIE